MAFRDDDKISEQINKVLKEKLELATRRGLNQEYATTLKNRIVRRTRLGTGVDPETAVSKKLKGLSKSYKRQRKGEVRYYTSKSGKVVRVEKDENNTDYVRAPKLPDTTTPSKSNLTATGQLLKAVTAIRFKKGNNIIFRFTVGARRGRSLFNQKSTANNKEIVDYQAAQGRSFLGFTRAQLNEIRKDIRQFIRQFLK